ncbi:hypothetical protein [Jiangella sp. DSM 45060]|uniref:hypothetical protein n=1 Tax=Jiangella sp. DSM 45060 TaxID=1798224 RepID=UPI00087A1F64|nr:hypothetical protein [Jiangella sp. DSM 45060]SDT52670.1 hypothetical protein SAMN04515669_4556 [Jiangella sp. DSM 45060]
MEITTLNPLQSGVGFAYAPSLRGVSLSSRERMIAPVTAPQTGEVRPQAGSTGATTHLVDGVKQGVRVRTWGPPV